jgi:hypothetical protein
MTQLQIDSSVLLFKSYTISGRRVDVTPSLMSFYWQVELFEPIELYRWQSSQPPWREW